jgi:hypothetical protein
MSNQDHVENNQKNSKKSQVSIPNPSPDFVGESSATPEKEQQSAAAATHRSNPGETGSTAPKNQPVPESEARTWAMLAHLSVLLNLFSGFLGGIAAIVIYFVYKDRSRFVAYHAMQSFIFQSITWIGSGIVGGIFIAIASIFGILIIPLLCLIPGILILMLAPASAIYGIIGGVQVNNGEDFRYWQVGDWVRNILEPEPTKE